MDKIDKLRQQMKEKAVDLIALAPGANLNWLLGVNPHADERPLIFLFFSIETLRNATLKFTVSDDIYHDTFMRRQ